MKRRTNGGSTSDDTGDDVEDRWTQAAQRHFDPDQDGELTTAIVYAIAAAEGVSPSDVKSPPLYESIDASALQDTFFGPDVVGVDRQGIGTVEFRYDDYRVTVQSDGWIQVYEQTEPEL